MQNHSSVNLFRATCLLSVIMVTITLTSCHDDDASPSDNIFVGEWIISSASSDNENHPEWSDKSIRFSQITSETGHFEVPETPYDSVFNIFGSWTHGGGQTFFRNDGVKFTYAKSSTGGLFLHAMIPWTAPDMCDDNGICNAKFAGNWMFVLKEN
jgi:hypothetical protein